MTDPREALIAADKSADYNRGWADGNASALDACDPIIRHLQASVERLQTALRVASHDPHDQAGEPIEGFPVCSVCGAIQVGEEAEPR